MPTTHIVVSSDIIHVGFAATPKFTWPELRGVDGQTAKATIEKENPVVTGVIKSPGDAPFGDICCNRVVIHVDNGGVVKSIPMVG